MLIEFEEALSLLKSGKLVAIPTETVYGLAGRIDLELTLRSIFETKKRPFFDPLIIHVGSIEQVDDIFFEITSDQKSLMNEFWPGPLTIVAPKRRIISDLISADLETVGVRMPNHELTLKLINELKVPLAAPSANMFKKTSPTSPEHVLMNFDNSVKVLDGGNCKIGIESTVLEIKKKKIYVYRLGQISIKQIQEVLPDHEIMTSKKIKSPGSLDDHYQPNVPFYLLDHLDDLDKFKDQSGQELILDKSAAISARIFYKNLIDLSNLGVDFIYFDKSNIAEDENWDALRDRLEKASTKF